MIDLRMKTSEIGERTRKNHLEYYQGRILPDSASDLLACSP